MSLCSAAPTLRDCLALVRAWHRDRFDTWCRGTGAHSLGAALGLAPADRPPILEAQPTAWDCFAGGRKTAAIHECITRKLTLAVAVYAGTDVARAQPLVMLPVLTSSTVLEAAHRTPDLHVFVLDGIARVLPIRRVRLNVPITVGPEDRWVWGAIKPAPPLDADPGVAYCQGMAAWDASDLGVTHRCLTCDAAMHMLVVAACRHPDAATRTAAIRTAMATGNWPVGLGWTGVTHLGRLNSTLAHVAQITTYSSPQQDAGPAVRQLGDAHVGVVDIFATSEGQNVGLTAALALTRLRHGASPGGDPKAAVAAIKSVAGGDGDVPAALVNGKVVLAARGDVGHRPGEIAAVLELCGPGAYARWHGNALWVFTVPGLLLDGDGRWLGSADPQAPPPRLLAPDVIGCVSAAGPYVGFNQASRATFSYNMMQRAAGLGAVPGAGLKPRLKDVYTLEYGQSPIVTTCSTGCGRDDLMCGTGQSCSVVVLDSLASGGNPEDAVMVSQKFADLGGLSLRRETTLEATEDGLRGKYLGKAPGAPFALPVDDDGLISAGTVVRPGDVVAAFVDGSTIKVPPRWEPVGQVQSVAIWQADNGDRTATIRLAACGIGLLDSDKLVPRACSQKGTIRLLAAEDMPWSPVPELGGGFDLVFSASALPSRMTPGYILEMVHGLLGLADPAGTGDRPPAPLFGEPGVEPVPETADRAAHLGVPTRIPVHDGATGVLQLGDRCGYGFVYTTTLFEHRARPKCYGKTRMASRVDQKTGQPLKGRAVGGSGRCGEMEKDALVMHGAMEVLQERFAAGGTGSTPTGDRAVRLLQAELAGCGIRMTLA